MNPAALKTNLGDLETGGILIVNEDAFVTKDLRLAGYESNPLDSDRLRAYQLFRVPMTKITRQAVEGLGLSQNEADRCRNFFAMGLLYWLYGRDMDPTLRFIESKFGGKEDRLPKPTVARCGPVGTTARRPTLLRAASASNRRDCAPGKYRNIMGNQALAWGLIAAAHQSDKELFFGTYPITPATDILHELSKYKNFGVRTFQAEDEIAGICAAIGAAFGGALAVTASSGPGIALKGEALGLMVMLELPLVIVSVQRGGPSTGLPTKTEQSDLFQALFGRHGECPLPVIAARSPADCFDTALEAWRIAVRFMTPVMLLSDGYLANGSEPWRIPSLDSLPKIPVEHPGPLADGETFLPYQRNERLARPWALPGTPGLMHRIGGLEKQDGTGSVSYDADNHQNMIHIREQKVANVALDVPPQEVVGPRQGKLLVVSWGGTFGSCYTAVKRCQAQGLSVAHAHLRYLNPLPRNLGEILNSLREDPGARVEPGSTPLRPAGPIPQGCHRPEQGQREAVHRG